MLTLAPQFLLMGAKKFIHSTVIKEAAKEFTNLRNVTFHGDQAFRYRMHLKTNYTGGYRTNENDTTKEWGKMSVTLC